MNNAVTVFQNARPAQAFQTLDPSSESLADGIGSSYGVIRYKGKVWSLQYKGENHIFTRPDDGSPSNYIDVVVLRAPGHKAKSYYKDYEEGAVGVRPVCASMDGVRPDADVQVKQADVCGMCPRNVWKTDSNGRKSRECSDYKRLAVLLMPDQTKRLLGDPLVEPVFLRVPPDSLTDLGAFGERMTRQGWHFSTFVTRIKFDPTKAHPKFLYQEHIPLGEEEAGLILQLREEPLAKRITGEEIVSAPVTTMKAVPQSIGLAAALKPKVEIEAEEYRDEVNLDGSVPVEDKSLDDRIAELMKV